MLKNDAHSYGSVSKSLHWLIALIIICLVGVGTYMTGLDKQDPSRSEIYELHKATGVILLTLVFLRILWGRIISPVPKLPAAFEGRERLMITLNRLGLYLLMIIVPTMGILMSQLYGKPVNVFDYYQLPNFVEENRDLGSNVRFLHGNLAWLLIVLTVLHTAGALKSRAKEPGGEKDILRRML